MPEASPNINATLLPDILIRASHLKYFFLENK